MKNKLSRFIILVLAIAAYACNDEDKPNFNNAAREVDVTVSVGSETWSDGTLYGDEEITFIVHVKNERTNPLERLDLGFRVYSPDGVVWPITTGAATSTLDAYMETAPVTPDESGDGDDVIEFRSTAATGGGFPGHDEYDSYTITINPVYAANCAGETIIIDQHEQENDWFWATAGDDDTPGWDGPVEFHIGPPRNSPQVSIRCVDGLDEQGRIIAGQVITFHVWLNNDTEYSLESLTHGLRVFPQDPDNEELSWTTMSGEWEGDVAALYGTVNIVPLDDGDETYVTIPNGIIADTLGFAAWAGSPGVSSGWAGQILTVQIGPIDPAFAGEWICFDKCDMWPPSHDWHWDPYEEAGEDELPLIEPTWYEEPMCYEIVAP